MAAEQDWLARVLSRWETLFDEVDWEEIPLELVERMVIHMKDGRVIDLNIKQMAKEFNLNYDRFEEALEMRLDDIESALDHVDWYLDTGKAVRVIESATNQILKDI
jgi:hypothetical protein